MTLANSLAIFIKSSFLDFFYYFYHNFKEKKEKILKSPIFGII